MVDEDPGVPSVYFPSQQPIQYRNPPASFRHGQSAQASESAEGADGPTNVDPSPTEARRRSQAAARRGKANQAKRQALKRGLNHNVEPTNGREKEDETPRIDLGIASKTLSKEAKSAKNALQVRDAYIH